MLDTYLKDLPLIAILRGVTPDEIVPVGRALYDAGFRVIEIPLNSPQPFDSIRRLTAELGEDCLIGAGTVLTEAQVAEVDAAGGRLIVSPNANLVVIRASKAAGLVSAPGVATPSEGFAALDAGADSLKLFPAEQLGPAVVKAWRAVFPKELALLPVGGITPDNMGPYVAAGANGFGLGSALYKPGLTAAQVSANAQAFAAGWAAVKNA
ncbi:2-dehydro-3-deoxy-6-phosphogalactonate aldolase [Pseudomonas oryzihabitans]|uniref:2-dehydro-3-deoxy-6-phosphogalactonate aldolase n=1 Tax=Pseudomonas oryzihabitans TaxID=47885 RepID=UPI00111ED237|nr:2-dehydro-3-deoxy-6-phosphogalactonate aldolase [Pseudomonas psychrotolerans]QDD90318.1 2-dehydro-3-deoxy-6-phosphogalactonate aldolase [Pseudomonas psychrotolerans]